MTTKKVQVYIIRKNDAKSVFELGSQVTLFLTYSEARNFVEDHYNFTGEIYNVTTEYQDR